MGGKSEHSLPLTLITNYNIYSHHQLLLDLADTDLVENLDLKDTYDKSLVSSFELPVK